MTSELMRGHQATLGIDEALQLDLPDESVDALAPGQHIHHGQYHIHGVLGRGSFATVYDAEHLGLSRRVAIKVPLLNCDKKALLHERFVREARLSALVQHPNVLAIYDAGSLPDGTPFLVLERVEGDSLNERFVHGVLPIAEVIEIGRQMATALTSLAAADIVHRDIKPANVMLHRLGGGAYQVKLVDLGVAKRRTPMQAPMRLTMQGELIGTPQYMSSEQLRGEEVDARTDIYGTAAVLYEALTGKPPHESKCFSDYMVAALSQPVPPVRNLRPDCPPELERLLLQALEREPAKRQASPEQLLAEFEACKRQLEQQERATREQSLAHQRASDARAVGAVPTPMPPAPSPAKERPPTVGTHLRGWVNGARRTTSRAPRVAIAVGALLLLLGGSLVGQSTPEAGHAAVTEARLPGVQPVYLPSAARTSVDDLAPSAALPEGQTKRTAPEPAANPVPFAPPVGALPIGKDVPSPRAGKHAEAPPERAEQRVAGAHNDTPAAVPVQPEPEVAQVSTDEPRPGQLAEPSTHGRAELAPQVDGSQDHDKLAAAPERASRTSKAREVATPMAVAEPTEPDALEKRAASSAITPATAPTATTPPAAATPRASMRTSGPSTTPQASLETQKAMASALKAFAAGRLSEARASYQQVLRANPSHAAALRGLGLVSATLGQPEAARQALRRYLTLTPNAPDAAQITARIQALGRP